MANQPHHSPRAILWDMDGTLLDSAEYHWLSWRDTLIAAGYRHDAQYFIDTFGQRNDKILRNLLGPDVSEEDIQRLGDDKEARYRRLISASEIELLPGVAHWLAALHAAGWRQAIASSAPRLNIEAVLAALGIAHYFDATVASEDVTAGKPDPQVFLTAAARLATPPVRCVVVEDSPFGIEGARHAGMRSVGVGPHCTAMGADLAACSLDGLPTDAFERLVKSVNSLTVG